MSMIKSFLHQHLDLSNDQLIEAMENYACRVHRLSDNENSGGDSFADAKQQLSKLMADSPGVA